MQAAAEAEVQQLQSSLESTNELLHKAMEAARTAEAEASTAAAAAQQEMDTMRAKLAEAAGVLNAKEELREARCVSSICTSMSRALDGMYNVPWHETEFIQLVKLAVYACGRRMELVMWGLALIVA
jgi:hypothetical protein